MSSDKKKTSIPIIGFVLHRLKLLGKSKLFTNEGFEQFMEKKKEKKEKAEVLNLNLLGRLSLSKPHLIVGHILLWYKIPVIIGITLSLIFGFYFETYIRFIDYLELNPLFRITAFMIGLTPMALIVSLVSFLRTFDEEYDIVGDRKHLLNANELLEVAQTLSWSEAEPEVEDADWVRNLLEQLWPNVNIFLIRLISFYCPNCSLDQIVGPINQLAKLEIKSLYLGERVPKITGIHVMNRGVRREDLIIDCELTFDSDLNIEIKGLKLISIETKIKCSLISGKYFIDFGIKWFYFKAKTRILLTPLFRDLPVVGNVQISFLEKPKINWKFTGLLTIMNWDFVKNCVTCVVSYFFENPHYFVINLAKILPIKEMKLKEPIGLLRVEVMSAKYAERTDMTRVWGCLPSCARQSDPYCKVEVEEQEMSTNVIRNNSNPEWYQEFCFLVHNSIVNSIVMSVLDEDMIEDQLIGRFSIQIKDFVDYQELNGREVTVPLTKANQRSQEMTKNWPRMSFRVSWFKLTTDIKFLDNNLRVSRAQLPVASLSVHIDSATGLDSCTAQVRSPELRPLVKISVGNQVRYTTCKRRTGCPVWEESHHFILYNPIWETIHIEVIDMYYVEEKQLLPFIPVSVSTFGALADTIGLTDTGTVLGTYDVPTNDILKSHKMRIDGSYRLNGFVENGHIRLMMAIRIAEFQPFVTENVRKPRINLSTLMEEVNKRVETQNQDKHLNGEEKQKSDTIHITSETNPEEVVLKQQKIHSNKQKDDKEMDKEFKAKNTKINKEMNDESEEGFTPLTHN